jgi:hypothetical protein
MANETVDEKTFKEVLGVTYLIVTIFSGLVLIFILMTVATNVAGIDATVILVITASFVMGVLWLRNIFAKLIFVSILLTMLKYFFGSIAMVVRGIYGVGQVSVKLATGQTTVTALKQSVAAAVQNVVSAVQADVKKFS